MKFLKRNYLNFLETLAIAVVLEKIQKDYVKVARMSRRLVIPSDGVKQEHSHLISSLERTEHPSSRDDHTPGNSMLMRQYAGKTLAGRQK